jgi:hypothetical protein
MHKAQRVSLVATLAVVMTGSIGVLTPLPRNSVVAQGETTSESEPPQHMANPETYRGSFMDTSVAAILKEYDVHIDPADKVTAFPDPALGIGSLVTVRRAPLLTVLDGAKVLHVHSWSATVSSLLAEQRIDLGDSDKVTPALTAAPGANVVITLVSDTDETVSKTVPNTTVYQDDPTTEKGTQTILDPGHPGTQIQTFHVHREQNADGVKVTRTLTKIVTQTPAVNKIVERGTKIILLDAGAASYYAGIAPMSVAHKTLPKGTKVWVVNEATGARVLVTVMDRGPYINGRVVDLSKDAFAQIGSVSSGVIPKVRVEKYYPPS